MKKIAVVSDFHCGHAVGLTPPEWNHRGEKVKFSSIRQECWDFFSSQAKKYGPFDVVIDNGDNIDGKGTKAEGVEIIFPDRMEQAEMAVRCLNTLLNKKTKLERKVSRFNQVSNLKCINQ